MPRGCACCGQQVGAADATQAGRRFATFLDTKGPVSLVALPACAPCSLLLSIAARHLPPPTHPTRPLLL